MTRRERNYSSACHRCGTGTQFDRVTHACGCVHQYCLACLANDFSGWDFPSDKICSTKDWIAGRSREHLREGGAAPTGGKMIRPRTVIWDSKTRTVLRTGDWPWSPGSDQNITTNAIYAVTWFVRCPVRDEERHGRILAKLKDGSMPDRSFKRVRLTVVPLDFLCVTPELRIR